MQLSALCLSGGGIRSAAFCLGALQTLAAKRMLRQFDFLSTVSGGGFIGGLLAASAAAIYGMALGVGQARKLLRKAGAAAKTAIGSKSAKRAAKSKRAPRPKRATPAKSKRALPDKSKRATPAKSKRAAPAKPKARLGSPPWR